MENESTSELLKFVKDIEFVQLLCNPNYLQYLSISGYLEDKDFLKYLEYLNYLKKPEFIKYITFSRCFVFLDLLSNKNFRNELSKPMFINYLHSVIQEDWSHVPKIMDQIQQQENI